MSQQQKELDDLKRVLKSLMQPPTNCSRPIDMKELLRRYRKQEHQLVPIHKFGYRSPLRFLKEKCSDCFTIQEWSPNPVLTLIVPPTKEEKREMERTYRRRLFHNFLKRRVPEFVPQFFPPGRTQRLLGTYEQIMQFKKEELMKLKHEVHQIVKDSEDGVWSLSLPRLYRERYKREIHLNLFGYSSCMGLIKDMRDVLLVTRPTVKGDFYVRDANTILAEREETATPPPTEVQPQPVNAADAETDAEDDAPCNGRCLPPQPTPPPPKADPEDALPGVPYEPDVFPSDCMQLEEMIPAASLDTLEPGKIIPVMVGEVYSPSHFWFNHLQTEYYDALADIMDEMMHYYTKGEGEDRRLARGAIRVGYFCAAIYYGNWHRAQIVSIIDDDHVKVRYIDYGTVYVVSVESLRPLLREWSVLPAQAIRGRHADLCPADGVHRWAHTASMHFFTFVKQRPLYAEVIAIKKDEMLLEVLLIDTSTKKDVQIKEKMIHFGLAEAASKEDSAFGDCYFKYPSFDALENGDTPSLDDIDEHRRAEGDPWKLEFFLLEEELNLELETSDCIQPVAVAPSPRCLTEARREARVLRRRKQRAARAARKEAQRLPPPPSDI